MRLLRSSICSGTLICCVLRATFATRLFFVSARRITNCCQKKQERSSCTMLIPCKKKRFGKKSSMRACPTSYTEKMNYWKTLVLRTWFKDYFVLWVSCFFHINHVYHSRVRQSGDQRHGSHQLGVSESSRPRKALWKKIRIFGEAVH